MNKITPVVIAILHKGDRFLLAERDGKDPEDAQFGRIWNFPGGGVEFKEDPQTALIREIKEELSLTIQIDTQLPRIFSAVRTHWHGLLIPYLCSIVGKEKIQLDSEAYQFGWFTPDEIKNMYTLPFVNEMLSDAMDLLKKG